MSKELKCSSCSYTTSSNFNFKRHGEIHEDVQKSLKCVQCSYTTSKKSNLSRHQRSHEKGKIPSKEYTCPMCGLSSSSRNDAIRHYVQKHDIVLKTKNLQFTNMDDFSVWKNQFEKETLSKFSSREGASTRGSITRISYRCHRDGFFVPRGAGKRHLKRIGSNKINGCCPAGIKVISDTSLSLVKVEVVETHVGHSNDVGRLSLIKEKRSCAAKSAAKIDVNVILNEIREDLISNDLSHIELVRRDLINIAHQFSVASTPISDQNKYTNVDSWVKNIDGAVRFYKPQGVPFESDPQLAEEDFILVIANDPQICLLKQFSNNCVCLDGTHGLNKYDFQLTTLLVVDDLRQGFPVAFMLSNKVDTYFVSVFLQSIKDALGLLIEPSVFMSDMSPVYEDAWNIVMLPPRNRLFSAWDVDSAWRKNLVKVRRKEKKISVYRTVRTLLQKGDKVSFQTLLESALLTWENDPDTAKFGKYFRKEYCGNVRQWAYCFRHVGLNMHLDSMHEILKHFYFQCAKVKRPDLCIEGLMKFVRDELFGRLMTICRGKVSSKSFALRATHRKAGAMKNAILSRNGDGKWTISSRSSLTHIEIGDVTCSCDVRCDECNICIHSYKCSCNDSTIKWNICCHVHFLIMQEKTPLVESPDISNDGDNEEFLAIVEESNPEKEVTFNEEKKRVLGEFLKTLNFAQNVQDLKLIMNGLAPMIPAMKASQSVAPTAKNLR